MDIFLIFFNMKVRCVFSYNRLIEAILTRTHNIPFSIEERKSPQIIPNLQLWNFFQGTQKRVRNSPGKRAISVRAIEVLLYS